VKDPTFLVISCSLNPASKSFRLAQLAEECFRELGAAVELRDLDLPFCDGRDSKLRHAALARISPHLTVEARHRPAIALLRLLAVLTVLFKYTSARQAARMLRRPERYSAGLQ
jgi:hypothetical protein